MLSVAIPTAGFRIKRTGEKGPAGYAQVHQAGWLAQRLKLYNGTMNTTEKKTMRLQALKENSF
ncbi:MAG: hypothetical protein DMG05_29100 [Acidobacteria bacterium]|nr:MAG: hypothetical protein DMG05_29100 [Acidobacteriota bacterium]